MAVTAASVFLLVSTWVDNGGIADFGTLVLNLVILFITATTLHFTIPEQARLWVDRQGELGIDDLLFYVEGDSAQGLPRDVLLQLHVAVSNVGGRKAVLSRLELTEFLDENRRSVAIGMALVRGVQCTIRDHKVTAIAVLQDQHNNLERFSTSEEFPGPFVLAPDDVITLRLRVRGGINWTERWDLTTLQELALALEHPVRFARLAATYRRGDEVVTQPFDVPLQVVQQSMYLEALHRVTKDFITRPDINPRVIPDL